jgi:hypothetical protein
MKNKKPLIIAGISLAVIGLGFIAYKLIQRARYNVVEGNNTTFLVEKETPKNVEEVDVEENDLGSEPVWETPVTEKLSYCDYEKDMTIFTNEARQTIFDMEKELAEFERTSNLGDR